MKYKHIISLGYYCGVAQELERIGLRSASYPFDWLITADYNKLIYLLENDFKGFLESDELQQEENKNHFYSPRNQIHFYHDFKDNGIPFESQFTVVKKKYSRRIDRLYESSKEPTLFLRYLSEEDVLKCDSQWGGGRFFSILKSIE